MRYPIPRIVLTVVLIACHGALAEPPKDRRLGELKDLNGYFGFTPPATLQAWNQRSEFVKRRILVSQGLWPLPERTPMNPVIHGRIDEGDYTIEKVYFESVPGFFVTGSLYRPKNPKGKVPAVVCPHGHWREGRFYDHEKSLPGDIIIGAERFENGGRNHIQARCVTLARLGCVAFAVDMIGYADSKQLSYDLVHRFAKQRPEMNSGNNWGFFSPQAEANLQNVMGLQTWNGIRSIDFLLTLPEVDPKRVAVTGASGGGTQTMLLGAVDDRVALSMPMVMVSTAMQGGCTCENASLLRIGTGNVEFAALFAPKPQIMNCANDWTRELADKGFPQLVDLYKLTGAKNHVKLIRGEHFRHNYNYVTRAQMYQWINQHFKLGHPTPIIEQDFQFRTEDELTVWDEKHPRPESGDAYERRLVKQLTQDSAKQLGKAKFAETYGAAWEVLIDRSLADVGKVEWNLTDKVRDGDVIRMSGTLRNTTHEEELPVLWLYPVQWAGRTAILLSGEGKAGVFDSNGAVREELRSLLAKGVAVVGVDLLMQGDFLKDGEVFSRTRKVENPREFAGFTFGYNDPLLVQRAHDVLTVVSFIDGYNAHGRRNERLDLIALDETTAPIALVARVAAGERIQRLAVNTDGFRFAALQDLQHPAFVPGAVKYGDVPGLIALNAPNATWVGGEKSRDILSAKHVSKGTGGTLTEAVAWLLDR
ncbi:MAG: acetylxylan esterase [Verrucomicrobiae bacterium]|nr:acetylxylan esterase [Verrucomicrobiae bacterium]